jgi:hypothetical protein
MSEIALVLFVLVEVAGVLIALDWLRHRNTPFPREVPRHVFRYVHREDRAAYVRIMRRTYAVACRDLNRSFNAATRQIGRALLPAFRALAAKLREVGR